MNIYRAQGLRILMGAHQHLGQSEVAGRMRWSQGQASAESNLGLFVAAEFPEHRSPIKVDRGVARHLASRLSENRQGRLRVAALPGLIGCEQRLLGRLACVWKCPPARQQQDSDKSRPPLHPPPFRALYAPCSGHLPSATRHVASQ